MSGREKVLLVAIPIVLAWAAHLTSLSHVFVNLDDPTFLLQNPLTTSPLGSGWKTLVTTPDLHYPIPVTVLGYAAQRSAFGLDPMAFHLVSLLLHIGVVVLIVALARRLGATGRVASLCASAFAIHPLTVEPVAWVVGQKDLIATLLILSALLLRAHPDGTRWGRSVLVAAACVLAMFAKPSAVCAPALVLVVDWMLERPLRRHLWLPLALAGVAALVTLLAVAGHESIGEGPSKFFGGRSLLNAAWAVGLQSMHAVIPNNLTVRYFEPDGVPLILGAIAGLAIAIALVTGFFVAARRGQRRAAAIIAFIAVAYAPVSGLVPISRGPADSYMYLPLALLAASGARFLGPLLARSRRVTITLCAAVAIAYLAISLLAHTSWRDAVSLWQPVVEKYPDNPIARTRLGAAYLFMKRPDRALEVLEALEREHPDFRLADGIHGDALAVLRRPEEAEPYYARAAAAREPGELERYGLYLTTMVTVEPSDPALAREAIAHIAPMLINKSTNLNKLARAAVLSERYGDLDNADRLRARLQTVLADPPP